MTPSQLSTELRRVAAALQNSKSPSRELVVKDLKRIIAKATTSDTQYASWASKAAECTSAIKTCEENLKSCMASGDWAGASESAAELAKATKQYGEHCAGNEPFVAAMKAQMEKGGHEASKAGSKEGSGW